MVKKYKWQKNSKNEAGRSKVRCYGAAGCSTLGEPLDLIYNVLGVGELLEHQEVRFETVHQHLALAWLGYVKHLLHHIVSKLVLGHLQKATASAKRNLSALFATLPSHSYDSGHQWMNS